jgi:predicted nuclease of restriction endonuclease-like (RecB) superfamily
VIASKSKTSAAPATCCCRACSPGQIAVEALPADYGPLLAEIKARVQVARIKAGLAANRELLALYWDIGRLILQAQERQGYGKKVVERLAADLQRAFPGVAGFSPLNVWRMRAFYAAHAAATTILSLPVTESTEASNLSLAVTDSGDKALPSLIPEPFASLPWSHNLLLLHKLDTPADRLWYASKTLEFGWSRNVLPTPTPKTSSSSSPPSGCLPRSAGRRCRRWKKPSARAARWAAKPGARWCWSSACAPRCVRFNPTLPPEAITNAVDELTRDRSAMSLEAANREVYRLLKEGITVSVPDREHGGQKTERLRVVDWEHPENNDFLLVSQFSVTGSALHLPARSGRLRQWPALGGDRTQEARRAGARRLRREPHPLQAADSGAVLEQRAAHRQQRHRQPRRLAHRRLGALGGVEAHRARGRAAPRVAGSDAARHLRPHPPARSGRELHAVFRAQGRAGQGHRPEPPVPRRQ